MSGEGKSRQPDAAVELGVFEKMKRVSERLDQIAEANAGELWTIERLRAVLATIQDANVTYGIIGDGGESVTPMMVERDALVDALYGETERAAPMDEKERTEREAQMVAASPVEIAAGTTADDPWVEEQLANARLDLDALDQALIAGTLARREVLRLMELTPLATPFRTSNGHEHDNGDCWAVDRNGRLHKAVGGRWYAQSDHSQTPAAPVFVVRVA